jgi:acyl-CoA thioesterase I
MACEVRRKNSRVGRILVAALLAFGGAGLLSACKGGEDARAEQGGPGLAKAGKSSPSASEEERDARPVIVAFGDSLTAGYGLAVAESYPALLQKRRDDEGYNYRVVNAGISGDTTAGGLSRIDSALRQEGVKFIILELGANDMLRGQDLRVTKKNLAQMIQRAQKRGVKVILAGMEAPTNYGEEYQRDFHNLFPDLAKEYQVALIPFFLADVAGMAELNQGDGVHPNAKGTEAVVENVWRVLEPLLEKTETDAAPSK